jgi:hypothetical protein
VPGRLLTTGLVGFLLAAGAAMLVGPMLPGPGSTALPPFPYPAPGDLASLPPAMVAAVGAYEAIRETLARGSTAGIPRQAAVIERTFASSDPKICSLAKRLAAEQDVESARRAFMRLHRLMEKFVRRHPRD